MGDGIGVGGSPSPAGSRLGSSNDTLARRPPQPERDSADSAASPMISDVAGSPSRFVTLFDVSDDLKAQGLLTPRKKKSRFKSRPGPEAAGGPSTLVEFLAWPSQRLEDIARLDHHYVRRMQTALAHGVVLTSSYSGLGSAEFALGMLAKLQGSAKVVVYSACENDKIAQRCLRGHTGPTKPRHIFADILHRVPSAKRTQLKSMVAKALEQFAEERGKSPESNKWRQRLGERGASLRRALLDAMKGVELHKRAWCVVHNSYCPTNPRADPDLKNYIHIEAASNTCTPWSSSGNFFKWMDAHTLVVLAWALLARSLVPDAILNECTPAFEPQKLHAEIIDQDETEDMYAFMTWVHDATEAGLPVSRKRRWSLWLKKARFDVPQGTTFFTEAFRKSLMSSAEIFMCAPPEMLRDYFIDMLAKKLKLPSGMVRTWEANNHEWEHALPAALRMRLLGFRRVAQENGLRDDAGHWTPRVRVAICDLSQDIAFTDAVKTESCMALKRNSELFDMVANRMVHPYEHLLMQGFPVPGLVDNFMSAAFPFKSVLPDLKYNQVRQLAGN